MDRVKELIQLAQQGDQEAKNDIVKENAGLIWSIARKFMGRGYDLEDLFQVGSIGLLKCIEKFDLSMDVKFSTYAVPMIMGEIKRFLRDDGLIKVSRPLKEIAAKAKYAKEAMMHKNGAEPTVSQLAEAVGVSVEDLIMALEAGVEVESIYSTVYQNDGNPVYLLDKLENKKDDEENTIDFLTLKEMIGKLDKKERQVIVLRYFQDQTQSQVAKAIGISQVQVSRIEKRVLNAMRERFG